MFWLDHAEPENENGGNSYSNPYEAEMIRGLVKYLISRNHYGVGDIAILVRMPSAYSTGSNPQQTPYKAQLALLQTRLHAQCSVYLNKTDFEQLQEDKLIPEDITNANSLIDVDMIHLLRTATV